MATRARRICLALPIGRDRRRSSPLCCSMIRDFVAAVETFVRTLLVRVQEMLADFARQDLQSLADHAHWLKGAGGTVGFQEFTEPATRLESLANSESIDGIAATLQELVEIVEAIRLDASVESATACASDDQHVDRETESEGASKLSVTAPPRSVLGPVLSTRSASWLVPVVLLHGASRSLGLEHGSGS